MGLFGKLFGREVDKVGLIRELAIFRVRNDPLALSLGIDEASIKSLPESALFGLPEATIVSIVEAWAALKKSGATDDQAMLQVEMQRSSAGVGGALLDTSNLALYVLFRVSLEHGDRAPIEGDFLEMAIGRACDAYGIQSPFASSGGKPAQ
jgi:hypothetical protein